MDTEDADVSAGVLKAFPVHVMGVAVGVYSLGLPAGRTGSLSTNHVAIFLILVGQSSCVRLDVAPDENLLGALDVRFYNYAKSKHVIETHSLKSASDKTVQEFWQAIEQDSRHMFRFEQVDKATYGCRHWIWETLRKFEERNLLDTAEDLENARDFLSQQDHKRPEVEHELIDEPFRGKFLKNHTTPRSNEHFESFFRNLLNLYAVFQDNHSTFWDLLQSLGSKTERAWDYPASEDSETQSASDHHRFIAEVARAMTDQGLEAEHL